MTSCSGFQHKVVDWKTKRLAAKGQGHSSCCRSQHQFTTKWRSYKPLAFSFLLIRSSVHCFLCLLSSNTFLFISVFWIWLLGIIKYAIAFSLCKNCRDKCQIPCHESRNWWPNHGDKSLSTAPVNPAAKIRARPQLKYLTAENFEKQNFSSHNYMHSHRSTSLSSFLSPSFSPAPIIVDLSTSITTI